MSFGADEANLSFPNNFVLSGSIFLSLKVGLTKRLTTNVLFEHILRISVKRMVK